MEDLSPMPMPGGQDPSAQTGAMPKPPEGWARCHAYVERKRRFCRQTIASPPSNAEDGPRYCGNHSYLYEAPSKRKRVPCPVDPSHFIYEDTLTKHVQVCPRVKRRRTQEQESYYRENINIGGYGGNCEEPQSNKRTVERARRLAQRILHAYKHTFGDSSAISIENLTLDHILDTIPMMDLSKPELEAGLAESVDHHRIKSGGRRHLVQQASLLGHLRRVGALPSLDCRAASSTAHGGISLLELGAGRGMLGLVAAGAAASSPSAPNVHLVLVERAGTRSKADKILRTTKKPSDEASASDYLQLHRLEWTRIKCDLAHVHMPTVLAQVHDQAQKSSGNNPKDITDSTVKGDNAVKHKLLVVAKHLCGAGTDLALRSLRDISPQVDACVMATCCHGICTWDDYVGRDFLRRALQTDDEVCFGRAEFEMMLRWTSGTVAVDGDSRKGDIERQSDSTDDLQEGEESSQPEINNLGGLQSQHETNDAETDSLNGGAAEHALVEKEDLKDPFSASSIVHDLNLACGVQGLGRACQRLLDHGRSEYMRNVLFREENASNSERACVVELCHYCPSQVTPQNAVLIAYRKNK